MQCYRKLLVLGLLVSSSIANANQVVEPGITPEQAVQMANDKGWFDGLNLSGKNEATPKDVEQFIENAQQQLQDITHETLSESEALTKPSSISFMFVSLSMPRASLIDAFKNAAASGTTVYINGMFDGDKNILDTMARLQAMTQDMVVKPTVKFGPSWFKLYQVNRVPALVYDDSKIQIKMIGMTQMDFFTEKVETVKKTTDFGAYGATFPVEERSLVEQIKQRMSQMDWEQKQRDATKGYWEKRPRYNLTLASTNNTFYIDATVQIQRDVVNRAGVVLAKAGDKFNPLAQMPDAYLGLYIVDPTDALQLAWLDKYKDQFDYRDQIIVTRLDDRNGWEQLGDLRKRYKRDIYLLEKELITKFAIKAVPSVVSVEKNYIKVREFNVRK
ncbi:TrbC family F-type conjugative pilus assembly protein [Shewanella algicola]|uniref:TrbC family F-type conjugative pilus assembly protein n=1 Tax=Shewanella algicola TaxID=640633 RepID=UPI002494E991|nr:TrbC family F-type conjugative pilus assembly protein [Shewanella algicola]